MKFIGIVYFKLVEQIKTCLQAGQWQLTFAFFINFFISVKILYNLIVNNKIITNYQYYVITISLVVITFVTILFFLQIKKYKNIKKYNKIATYIFFGLIIITIKNNHIEEHYTNISNAVQHWNVYHYYIGSKYFKELGYNELYAQTIAADREGALKLSKIKKIRDMQTYEKYKIGNIAIQRNSEFTDERWDEFKKDINFFLEQYPLSWKNIMQDRGYNATPFWNMIGSSISDNLDITTNLQRILVVHLDIVLGLIAVLTCIWAFGSFNTSLLFLIFVLLPFNKIIGNFLKFDFFYFLLIALAFYKKEKFIPAGICLSYSIMARIFPIFFVLGVVILSLNEFIMSKKIPYPKLKFLITVFITCAVFFIMSGLHNPQGFKGWCSFKTKIDTHNENHIYGQNRVGLKYVFTQEIGDENLSGIKEDKVVTLKKQLYFYFTGALIFIFLYLVTIIRQNDIDILIWGIILIFVFFVTSRYYWSIIALMPILNLNKSNFKGFISSIFPLLIIVNFNIYAITNSEKFLYFNLNKFVFWGFLLMLLLEWMSCGTKKHEELKQTFSRRLTV